jgi:hypothetical protein
VSPVSTVLRALVGIVLGAVVGAVVFLIMVQGSFRQGYTDLDFNHVLGTMIKGSAEEQRGTSEALGVVGDTAGPAGLYGTLIGAGVLMVVFAVAIAPFVRRHWVVQGLVLGVLTTLVVGVVFCAVADARLDTPTGIFGAESGGMTPLVITLSSLAFGLLGARCYSLAMTARWWEEREEDVEAEIESIAQLDPSLELPEEGPEHRRVGA